MPEKLFEGQKGLLFLAEEHRLHVLGMLLENVGAERVVQFGDPQVWRDAVAKLGDR